MKILSLSTVFPNPQEPGLGPFVPARLRALSAFAEVQVVAPVAPFDYDNPSRKGFGPRSTPRRRREPGLGLIHHPAWLYPPGNGAVKGPLLAAQLIPLLLQIRKDFRFDLIDAHFLHPEGVAACLLARAFAVPFVATMRGNELDYARKPFHRSLMRWAVRRAARVFPVSQQLGELAVSLGADPERVRVIGPGVDRSTYRIREPPPPNSRRTVILTAGRLIPLKGFQHILRALVTLRERGLDAELHIAGEAGRGFSSYAEKLCRLAASLGLSDRLHLLGWVPPEELARRMSRADVFCLASSREGAPNVVMEALACGAPVVASDVGDARCMVGGERHGLCVPPGDVAALAAALERALRTDWDRPALSAYAHQRSWSQVAGPIFAELEAVLRNP